MSATERERLLAEYRRREREIPTDRYAAWQPAEILMREERKRLAATLLHRANAFPDAETPCLEVGYGRLGWLADLLSWGVGEKALHGVELDAKRAAEAQHLLPTADLRTGDASELPFADETFGLVVASTVFTSVLDDAMRRSIAAEIERTLRPGGALLWYDFRFNSPGNPNVRGIGRRELRALFPDLGGEIRSLTLAPPLARLVAPRSYPAAVVLAALPPLRSHLTAVLLKPEKPAVQTAVNSS